MQIIPWTISEGKISEISFDGKVLKLEKLIDLSIIDINEALIYFKILSQINKLEPRLNKLEQKPIEVEENISPVVEIIEDDRNYSYVGRGKSRADVEPCFRLPNEMKRAAFRHIPVAAIDIIYNSLAKGSSKLSKIVDVPEWHWHKELIYDAMNGFVYLGVAQRTNVKGHYELAPWPREKLREICIKKGIQITPLFIRENFWVPESVASDWLEQLAQGSFLKKHPRHGYDVVDKNFPVQIENESLQQPHQQSQVFQAKIPSIDSFSFVKGKNKCTICQHNYGHAYISGSWKICGGDYEKLGGKKTHGKDATIAR